MDTIHANPDARTGTNAADTHHNQPRIHPKEMRSLEEILGYKNPKIIERYMREHGMSEADANLLFQDVLKFMYLCAVTDRAKEITPTIAIDEGWHEFLMFTKDYHAFCKEHFGFFIHHEPFTAADKARGKGAPRAVTLQLAHEAFGSPLSENWAVSDNVTAGDCTGGQCSGDCCPVFGD